MAFEPNIEQLTTALDIVLPPVDDLPGAGDLGIAQEVIDRSKTDERFWAALETVTSRLDGEITEETLSAIESGYPEEFGMWLDIVYTVYYMQPQVHAWLGWHGRSPQPEGNTMPPWDESVLVNARKREPFWRKI